MLDETIITETPPLYSCYGHIGEQVRVPITGNRAKRILHGAINVGTGEVAGMITKDWTKGSIRTSCRWSGPIGGAGTSCSSRIGPRSIRRRRACDWAADLKIEVRLLPKATPELNAMDHLWRHTKREAWAIGRRSRSRGRPSMPASTSST